MEVHNPYRKQGDWHVYSVLNMLKSVNHDVTRVTCRKTTAGKICNESRDLQLEEVEPVDINIKTYFRKTHIDSNVENMVHGAKVEKDKLKQLDLTLMTFNQKDQEITETDLNKSNGFEIDQNRSMNHDQGKDDTSSINHQTVDSNWRTEPTNIENEVSKQVDLKMTSLNRKDQEIKDSKQKGYFTDAQNSLINRPILIDPNANKQSEFKESIYNCPFDNRGQSLVHTNSSYDAHTEGGDGDIDSIPAVIDRTNTDLTVDIYNAFAKKSVARGKHGPVQNIDAINSQWQANKTATYQVLRSMLLSSINKSAKISTNLENQTSSANKKCEEITKESVVCTNNRITPSEIEKAKPLYRKENDKNCQSSNDAKCQTSPIESSLISFSGAIRKPVNSKYQVNKGRYETLCGLLASPVNTFTIKTLDIGNKTSIVAEIREQSKNEIGAPPLKIRTVLSETTKAPELQNQTSCLTEISEQSKIEIGAPPLKIRTVLSETTKAPELQKQTSCLTEISEQSKNEIGVPPLEIRTVLSQTTNAQELQKQTSCLTEISEQSENEIGVPPLEIRTLLSETTNAQELQKQTSCMTDISDQSKNEIGVPPLETRTLLSETTNAQELQKQTSCLTEIKEQSKNEIGVPPLEIRTVLSETTNAQDVENQTSCLTEMSEQSKNEIGVPPLEIRTVLSETTKAQELQNQTSCLTDISDQSKIEIGVPPLEIRTVLSETTNAQDVENQTSCLTEMSEQSKNEIGAPPLKIRTVLSETTNAQDVENQTSCLTEMSEQSKNKVSAQPLEITTVLSETNTAPDLNRKYTLEVDQNQDMNKQVDTMLRRGKDYTNLINVQNINPRSPFSVDVPVNGISTIQTEDQTSSETIKRTSGIQTNNTTTLVSRSIVHTYSLTTFVCNDAKFGGNNSADLSHSTFGQTSGARPKTSTSIRCKEKTSSIASDITKVPRAGYNLRKRSHKNYFEEELEESQEISYRGQPKLSPHNVIADKTDSTAKSPSQSTKIDTPEKGRSINGDHVVNGKPIAVTSNRQRKAIQPTSRPLSKDSNDRAIHHRDQSKNSTRVAKHSQQEKSDELTELLKDQGIKYKRQLFWKERMRKMQRISDEMRDEYLRWNADLVCPVCFLVMPTFSAWKKHFDHLNKCTEFFIDKTYKKYREKYPKLFTCPPCEQKFKDFPSWSKHMFTDGPHGKLGTVAFPKGYLDSYKSHWIQEEHLDGSTDEGSPGNICGNGSNNPGKHLSQPIRPGTAGKPPEKFINNLRNQDSQPTIPGIVETTCGNDSSHYENQQNKSSTPGANGGSRLYLKEFNKIPSIVFRVGFLCSICTMSFSGLYEATAATHVYDKHLRMAKHMCLHCSKTFTSKKLLQSHEWHQHTKNPPVKCHICEKSFAKPGVLERHVRTHRDLPKEPCPVCGQMLPKNKYWRLHMKNFHSDVGSRIRKCLDCGKDVPIRDFRQHTKIHTREKRRTVCEICGLSTSYIKRHMRRHETTMEERKRACPICGVMVVGLQGHMRFHKERKFTCDICGKKFFGKHHLETHMKGVHQNVRPFKCSICEFEFTLKHHLNAHIKRKHESIDKESTENVAENNNEAKKPKRYKK